MRVYVTFGHRCAGEHHPLLPDAHPDGWYTADAPDGTSTADLTVLVSKRLNGVNWSMVYRPAEFEPGYFPRGCLGHLGALS